MYRLAPLLSCFFLLNSLGLGQSPSFSTFMNPVIPGDHPDCTLSRVGKDFYTTGSSFNPTPVIYHSTDLVHWEAIAQPVSAAWTNYGDTPAGGCWGGQVVYHNNAYWHFFSRSNVMYFVSALQIAGPWTLPTQMNCPASVPGLGYDNSIFIDDDDSWYLLVKNGQVNNWIVQLGDDGQPGGAIYNLTWLNPAPSYPFSWAEGPVMWKYKGYYYYSFARNVAGGQKVFRSQTLTDDQSSWVNLGDFFDESDPLKSAALFQNPNHPSAAVKLDDSTSWVVHPLWRSANSNEWYGQGRQGLLSQVRYDASGKPTADYPTNLPKTAPKLPSSGIPWMVPHSDFFGSAKLNPEWSFLGYTSGSTYSLTRRQGWLTLSPRGKMNTILKNDGEHNYSIITRVDFQPSAVGDQAGIWITNGLQTLDARLYSAADSSGKRIIAFSYSATSYAVDHPSASGETIVWLKLVRVNHVLTAFCSADGIKWIAVGSGINVAGMENQQTNYNAWTGNRQGLFVQGKSADFDFYIYRDAYTLILAECPANQNGTSVSIQRDGTSSLLSTHDKDWAMYAGVEFGNTEYQRKPDSLRITASSASTGGLVEVWLDSLDTGTKIAECTISNTGSWNTYQTFTTNVLVPVSGMHDVYVRSRGTGPDAFFLVQWLTFVDASAQPTSMNELLTGQIPTNFSLEQNYPNPFNPKSVIRYSVPPWAGRDLVSTGGRDVQISEFRHIRLVVYDLLGREVAILMNEMKEPGTYDVSFDATNLASGVYVYRMTAGAFTSVKKMTVVK